VPACGFKPIADSRPETRLTIRLPGAAGAAGVTTADVTVGDAFAVRTLAVTAIGAAGALLIATGTARFDVATLVAGGSAAEDCAVDFEPPGCATGVGSDDDGMTVGAVFVVVLAVEVVWPDAAVVGSLLVVPEVVTDVLAPPDACTTDVFGSVDDWVDVDAEGGDVSGAGGLAVLVGSVLDALDVEPVDEPVEVLVAESVDDDAPVESANARPEPSAIATPNPNATARAPTRPI
jgi:hypothetical protein